MAELINGGVYHSDRMGMFTLIFTGSDHNEEGELESRYMMLDIHRHTIRGMSCPMAHTGMDGKISFTVPELREQYFLDTWKMLDGRLRIEKIDPDMCLCDYPIGELNQYSPSPR